MIQNTESRFQMMVLNIKMNNQDSGDLCPAGFYNCLRAVTPVGLLVSSLLKWSI